MITSRQKRIRCKGNEDARQVENRMRRKRIESKVGCKSIVRKVIDENRMQEVVEWKIADENVDVRSRR